jgi:arginyl-tRNA synthetase
VALVDQIASYPDVVRSAHAALEPSVLINYTLQLAHATHAALQTLYVISMRMRVSLV